MAMSGSKCVGFTSVLTGAHTDEVVYEVHDIVGALGLTSADIDATASAAKNTVASGTYNTYVTKDGYWLKGHIVNIMICSNVTTPQVVSIKGQEYAGGVMREFYLEKDIPVGSAPNNVIELTCICLEEGLRIKVSCTGGVDVLVSGLIDIGVA